MPKNILTPVRLFPQGTTMNTNLDSGVFKVQMEDNVAIQMSFSGNPVGDFAVQTSLDQVNWVSIPFTSTPNASGSPDDIMLNIMLLAPAYLKVTYTASSGTGTLDAFICAKGL